MPSTHTQCPVAAQCKRNFTQCIILHIKTIFYGSIILWFWYSFAELQSEKEELEKKYIHVLQILESEKTAKWQLLQQCEEQAALVSSLKTEVHHLNLMFL